MEQYPIVAVEWNDACISSFGSTYDLDQVKGHTLVECRSTGQLVNETDDRVTLAYEVQESEPGKTNYRFVYSIPKSCITRIVRYAEVVAPNQHNDGYLSVLTLDGDGKVSHTTFGQKEPANHA